MAKWISLSSLVLSLLIATSSEAGVIYRLDGGEGLEGYKELELVFEGSKVTGEARPYRGYNSPSTIEVTGDNPSDGRINLTFKTKAPQTISFKKSVAEDSIQWSQIGTETGISFWRPRRGEFSDYDLTLTEAGCGPLYKTLRIAAVEGATKEKLTNFLEANVKLANLVVKQYQDSEADEGASRMARELKLGTALHELLKPKAKGSEEVDIPAEEFDVPVGTEVTVAISLRKSDLFTVDLGSGGCGGVDASFVILARSLLFDRDAFAKDRFLALVERGLKSFAERDRSGRSWTYRFGPSTISTLEIAPFTSSYKRQVRIASEVTRQVPGQWDAFDVSFEPSELGETRKDEYAIVVTLENFTSTFRSSGREVKYSNEWAKEVAEAEANTALLSSLARGIRGARCFFLKEGEPETKITCERPATAGG